LFGDYVGQIYFRHDPDDIGTNTGKQLMVIFEIKKTMTESLKMPPSQSRNLSGSDIMWF
jgi:hypothetical protein